MSSENPPSPMQRQQSSVQRQQSSVSDMGDPDDCFSMFLVFMSYIVQQYERAVVFRLGRIRRKAQGPGLFFILPCVDEYRCVDLRTVTCDVPPQQVLSKDSVTVTVDAVVFYRVFNATQAVMMGNISSSTTLLAQTTLRHVFGTKTLSEILGNFNKINREMKLSMDKPSDVWGVEVELVELKNVRLPHDMQRSMAAEAEAGREARAKMVAAEGEHKAAKALRDASLIIERSPAALQLRYLQTLNTISDKNNKTIIFPVPVDLLRVISTQLQSGSNAAFPL
ncbi:hypothetical protein niasHS_007174 [Heterodera schachtii]|uniref:Band 7 domain-containing protein n=2 Tax=Heterodera TaxID=34509 RepID=A0ABD2JL94_HETSC